MINNEDSSFLREVEGRLDSLSAVKNEKKDEGTEQSKVISEIEKRFSAIFGDDNTFFNEVFRSGKMKFFSVFSYFFIMNGRIHAS